MRAYSLEKGGEGVIEAEMKNNTTAQPILVYISIWSGKTHAMFTLFLSKMSFLHIFPFGLFCITYSIEYNLMHLVRWWVELI